MLAILGILSSGVVALIKNKLGATGYKTMFALALVAISAAGIYCSLIAIGYWTAVANILVYAGAFYAFIIQPAKSAMAPDDTTVSTTTAS